LLKNCNAQVAISANWVNIISKNILDTFPHGVLNAHAGDLPNYRGNACANWAIINGEKKMGLCIHQMNEDLDAGDILVKDYFPLNENTYISDCYKFIESRTPQLFAKVLTNLSNNKVIFHKQSTSNVHRCFPRIPEDSKIIWDQPMNRISRIIRASSDPFSGAFSYLDNKKIYIWRATTCSLDHQWSGIPGQIVHINKETGDVSVLAADGLVRLQEISHSEGPRLKPSNLFKSIRQRLIN